jgi:pyridoxal/pyridoxine/pyridoxamine kinase
MAIKTQDDAFEAMKKLHDDGVQVVILSSSEISTKPG